MVWVHNLVLHMLIISSSNEWSMTCSCMYVPVHAVTEWAPPLSILLLPIFFKNQTFKKWVVNGQEQKVP